MFYYISENASLVHFRPFWTFNPNFYLIIQNFHSIVPANLIKSEDKYRLCYICYLSNFCKRYGIEHDYFLQVCVWPLWP